MKLADGQFTATEEPFNHPQFNPPDGNINDTGLFGFVTSAAPARIGQLALKFLF